MKEKFNMLNFKAYASRCVDFCEHYDICSVKDSVEKIYFTMVLKNHYLEIKPFTNPDVADKERFNHHDWASQSALVFSNFFGKAGLYKKERKAAGGGEDLFESSLKERL